MSLDWDWDWDWDWGDWGFGLYASVACQLVRMYRSVVGQERSIQLGLSLLLPRRRHGIPTYSHGEERYVFIALARPELEGTGLVVDHARTLHRSEGNRYLALTGSSRRQAPVDLRVVVVGGRI